MQRKAFTWVEMVVVVAILLILAAILFPIVAKMQESPSGRSCISNLKQIGLGFRQYLQDCNDTFPAEDGVQETKWAESIQPYLKSWQLFQCFADRKGSVFQTTDYFYNSELIGKQESKNWQVTQIILSGDGIGDSPTNYSLSELPKSWRKNAKSPAWRHLDGANYAFVDGHVKWLKPNKLTTKKPDINVYTFRVR